MPKIVKAYPPNYNDLSKVFPIKGKRGIIYAYGERIYNPSGVVIHPWVLSHETVHCTRQLATDSDLYPEEGLELWWYKYMTETQFRLDEEVLAHQAEWESIKQSHMSQRDKDRYLIMMAERLSSPLYGSMVTYIQASDLITHGEM